jgi:hypothetical protein
VSLSPEEQVRRDAGSVNGNVTSCLGGVIDDGAEFYFESGSEAAARVGGLIG